MTDPCQEQKEAYEEALQEESEAQEEVNKFNVLEPLEPSQTPPETNWKNLDEAQRNLREKTKKREQKHREYKQCKERFK